MTYHSKIQCADMMSVVVFSEKATILSPFVDAFDPRLLTAIDKLPSMISSSTNIAAAIRTANDLLRSQPKGLLRRTWIATDGDDNVEADRVFAETKRAEELHNNINTIGFGEETSFNPRRLKDIARATMRGQYFSAVSAHALGQVLKPRQPRSRVPDHRGEATVFCIDVSPSMNFLMGGCKKIDIVRETMFQVVKYKQQMWS